MTRLADYRERVLRLAATDYFANVARLAAGAGLAQAITLVTMPVITRLYPPGQYGVASTYAGLVSIFAPIAALRYDLAIVLPESDDEARLAVRLSAGLAAITAALLALVLGAGWAFTSLVAQGPLGGILLLLPLSVLATAWMAVAGYWANRRRRYGLMARNRVVAAALVPGLGMLAWAVMGGQALGLVLATLIGTVIALMVLVYGLGGFGRRTPGTAGAAGGYLAFAGRYRQFPTFNLGMTFVDQLSYALPVLLFASWFSPEVAGHYSLANGALRVPMGLVGQAVAQVFYERAAREQNRPAALRRLTVANVKSLAVVAVGPVLLVVALGPWLFPLFFGQKWAEAGRFAQYLAPIAALNLVASPISSVPTILHQQHIHFAFAAATAAVRLAALWLGRQTGSAMTAVAVFSAAEALMTVLFLVWLVGYLKRAERAALAASPSPAGPAE
jgi:O-antigen/teichoic acid export membrane protein